MANAIDQREESADALGHTKRSVVISTLRKNVSQLTSGLVDGGRTPGRSDTIRFAQFYMTYESLGNLVMGSMRKFFRQFKLESEQEKLIMHHFGINGEVIDYGILRSRFVFDDYSIESAGGMRLGYDRERNAIAPTLHFPVTMDETSLGEVLHHELAHVFAELYWFKRFQKQYRDPSQKFLETLFYKTETVAYMVGGEYVLRNTGDFNKALIGAGLMVQGQSELYQSSCKTSVFVMQARMALHKRFGNSDLFEKTSEAAFRFMLDCWDKDVLAKFTDFLSTISNFRANVPDETVASCLRGEYRLESLDAEFYRNPDVKAFFHSLT